MRDFAKVCATIWTGETGKKIRAAGRDPQVVAFYLITCPSSNMLGLYYLPLPTLCHEIGITKEGASKALRRVSEASFAHYDAPSEHVWVPEMARWQIGITLDPRDKRVIGIKRELELLRKSPFFNDFLKKYRDAFHLQDVAPEPSPIEAPSESHRSQETETETEKENKTGAKAPESLSPSADSRSQKRKRKETTAPPAELQPAVSRVVAKINELAGTSYRADSKIVLNGIVPRLRAGASEADCLLVVEDRWHRWKDDPNMREHFNPETLFRESNFEKYRNAARMANRNGNGALPNGGFVG